MADITRIVSDTLTFSGVLDPSGLIINSVGETISPSGASPSGVAEELNDTITVSGASPSGVSQQLDDTITVSPSGFTESIIEPFDDIVDISASGYPLNQNNPSGEDDIPFSQPTPSGQSQNNYSGGDQVGVSGALPQGSFTIGLPTNGQIFHHGDEISFSGNGTDDLADIHPSNVVWYSDRDGIIGKGTFFKSDDLSVGTHTITVSSLVQGQFLAEIQVQVLESYIAPRVEDVTDG